MYMYMYIIPCHPPKPIKFFSRMLGGANANLSVDAKLREILGAGDGCFPVKYGGVLSRWGTPKSSEFLLSDWDFPWHQPAFFG
jgi:hypothetical protein